MDTGFPRIFPLAKKGDLILWDSRTVHGVSPPWTKSLDQDDAFLRIAVYVCMRPFLNMDAASADAMRTVRADAYARGLGTAHMPHLFHPIYGTGRPSFDANVDAPPLDQAPADIRRLVLGAESIVQFV